MRPALSMMLFALCAPALILALTGCNSSKVAKAMAGAIAMTNGSGTAITVSTLPVGSTLHFSMTPVGGATQEGVDWVVTCKGNSVTGSTAGGSCGTLSTAHTAAGAATVYTAPSVVPIDGAITITATVSSNPAQSSGVSLTVTAQSVGIGLSLTPPGSVVVNSQIGVGAIVANDPANSGVYFSATCESAYCGSFNPVQVVTDLTTTSAYTAPSAIPPGGTVTITVTSLTDTSKSASATVQIVNPSAPVPVTVSVAPSVLYVQTSGTAHKAAVSALVGNDSANAGVDWSVSCWATSCGTVNPAHTASGAVTTYIAPISVPTGGTATITAKSTTNSAILATSTANIVTTAPIVVAMSSAPAASTTTGSTVTLAATVANDTNNLGVDWTASCSSSGECGTLASTHTASGVATTYTAPSAIPSGAVVTIVATSSASTSASAAANPAVAYTTIVAQSPSVLMTQAPSSTMVSLTQAAVIATVANDVDSAGVDWSVTCGSTVAGGCGWVVPSHTASGASAVYTAPPVSTTGSSVTVVATSTANSSKSASSSSIALDPQTTLSVSFVPAVPAQIQTGATVNLIAAVANDTANAGVDWKVCGDGCGFFTIKPAVAEVLATATTAYVPASAAVTVTTVSGWPNGSPIPYTAPPEAPKSGTVVVEALAHADGVTANTGTIAISTSPGMASLSGVVQAGPQTVAGATVALFAAGVSGYASAATQVATTTTNAGGSFTIPSGFVCPSSNSQMYLVAAGGTVGSNTANQQLGLMTALGSCAALPSSVVVNELTTIASAWAIAPFSGNDALYGKSSSLYLGTSTSNSTGLANGFATVNNLVDITTGKVRYVTPAGNAAVPFAQLNTLADILNACTATSGGIEGDGGGCGTLFTVTGILSSGYPQSIGPSDTLQSAFNVAQHPTLGYDTATGPTYSAQDFYALATLSSPFQPTLTSIPHDWSISLNYTSGGGLNSTSTLGSFAVDGGGNLWMADSTNGRAIEWNATGAAVTSASGFPAGGGLLTIDAPGNVWVSGDGVLTELTKLGDAVVGSPYLGVPGGGSDLSSDRFGNLWVAEGGGLYEFDAVGKEISPSTGFTNTGVNGIQSFGFDNANNLYIASLNQYNNGYVGYELTDPGAQLIATGGSGYTVQPTPVSDGSGHLWMILSDFICAFSTASTTGKATTLVLNPACTFNNSFSGGQYASGLGGFLPFMNAHGLAFDGSGQIWIASDGTTQVGYETSPNIMAVSPSWASGYGYYVPLVSSALSNGVRREAVDGAGNVWVLLANNTVMEFVGVAAPSITPVSLSQKNGTQGSKP